MNAPETPVAETTRASWPAGCGLVVVGHGTADPGGAAETRATAGLAAGLLPGVPVGIGFLEIAAPSIETAVARLAGRGCRELVAAPLLLFTAGHARRDVPEALAAAASRAGLAVRQADPLGCRAEIVSLSARRRDEALAGRRAVAPGGTALVMIGRGSSDPTAAEQFGTFAALSAGAGGVPCGRVSIGFAAAARPGIDEALAAAADPALGAERVVVQPHLLFRGHVLDQVAAAVNRWRAARADIEWLEVERLGADRAVAEALVAGAAAAAWSAP
jgi:sirohydrochlorin cobaltochelatase